MKPEQIRSFDDLLDEKWKGKMGFLDPRSPGSGASLWSYLREIKGEEFLKKLAGQKMVLGRDQRVLAENVAKGKLTLVMGSDVLYLCALPKSGLAGSSVAHAEGRGLHQRRQRASGRHEKQSPPQCDQSVH
jgi:ABC-type Fe3+ transport system substrate-binding protein